MSTEIDLPESFVEHVKQALENLYDLRALQENIVTQRFHSHDTDLRIPVTHQVRSQLIDAIESLNPGKNVALNSGTFRIYNMIYLHYVSRLTIQQAAWEVGVSLRQAYRDLRQGQELVSAVLWHNLNTETPNSQQVNSVDAELSRLGDNFAVIPLQDLLESAIRPCQILADKYHIAIDVKAPAIPIMLATNHIIAQQILTHILSQILQEDGSSCLSIELMDDGCFLRMRYKANARPNLRVKPIIQQMMDQINWELQCHEIEGVHELILKSLKRRALLMLIDDNESLTQLLQRYLTNDAYTVMSVPNTEQGLQCIQQLQPDAILLDVMMPGMDGWELLQRLRTKRETELIPVIICSVINDPELAFALGASQYVPKPITRESLLMALQALHI